MSVLTSVLKLFKYDPVADKKSTYNITQALNNNWDKIDAAMAAARSAEEYDPTATYAVGAGQRRRLRESLRRCIRRWQVRRRQTTPTRRHRLERMRRVAQRRYRLILAPTPAIKATPTV